MHGVKNIQLKPIERLTKSGSWVTDIIIESNKGEYLEVSLFGEKRGNLIARKV